MTAYESLYVREPGNFLVWAEENIELPRGHALPGQFCWREKTPYLWEISEAIRNPEYEEVVLWMPSQSGKTMLILLWMLHCFIFDPKPFTLAVPSKDLAKEMSNNRFMELVRGCKDYISLIDGGEAAETYEKVVNGVPLRFVWVSSANKVSSYATPRIAKDEINRMEDLKNEGDPEELLETRTTTYDEIKIISASSPLLEGSCKIAARFDVGTQQVCHKSCPQCKQYFEPKFQHTHWSDECKTEDEVRIQARVICPKCSYKINSNELRRSPYVYLGPEQHHNGERIVGDLKKTRIASFRVNGLCSGFNTIGKLSARWWKADKDKEKRLKRLQAVINTGFGEKWTIPGEEIDWESLRNKRLDYQKGEVPNCVTHVVSAADVHSNDLHYSVWGFDEKRNAFLADWGIITGDTREVSTWEKVDPVLYAEYDGYMVAKSGIDAGYRPTYVKNFCQAFPKKYYPVLGRQQSKPVNFAEQEVDEKKFRVSTKKRDIKILYVWDDYWKEAIFQRMEYSGDDQDSQIYFPKDVDDKFLTQITGEKRCETEGVVTFVKTRDNHFLDTSKICFAIAFEILKVGKAKRRV